MSKNRAWMPLHISDYMADTGHLTVTEHGAYMLLIMHYWQNGKLPDSEKMIARIARMSDAQWTESRDVLEMMFGEGWTHKRIDRELDKADDIIEKRRAAAIARHTKNKCDAHAEHTESNSDDTGAIPLTNNLSSSLRSEDDSAIVENDDLSKSAAKPKKDTGSPMQELSRVLSPDVARAVIEHRTALRAKLTGRAAKMLAKDLEAWHSPDEAANMMIRKGWRGFEADWMRNALNGQHGRPQPPPKPRTIFDAIDDFTGNRNDDPGCITIDHHDGATVAAPVRRLANSPWD